MFADDAIGFYLQLDDQLSPALRAARTNYKHFITDLTKLNTAAVRELDRAFGKAAGLVKAFADVGKVALAAYRDARASVERQMRPLVQRVRFDFGPVNNRGLSTALTKTIAQALRNARFRLSPAMPTRRNPLFKSGSLRQAYAAQFQPPDFAGRLNIPRFAKGGSVGGDPGMDNVLALLTQGEYVVTKEDVAELKKRYGKMADDSLVRGMRVLDEIEGTYGKLKSTGGKWIEKSTRAEFAGMGDLLADMQKLQRAALDWKGVYESTGDKAVLKDIDDATKKLNERLVDLRKEADRLQGSGLFNRRSLYAIEQAFSAVKQEVADLNKAVKGDGFFARMEKFLEGDWGIRFLALRQAISDVQDALGKVTGAVADVADVVGKGEVEDFFTNFQQMNRILGLSRDKLADFRSLASAESRKLGADLTLMGEATESLVEYGMAANEQTVQLAASLSLAAEGMGLEVQSMATFYAGVNQYSKLGLAGINELTAEMARLSAESSGFARTTVPAKLQESLEAAYESFGPVFFTLSKEAQQASMQNVLRAAASFSSETGAEARAIAELVAEAASGTEEGIRKASLAFGMSSDQVRESLQTAEGTAQLMSALSQRVGARSGDPLALQQMLRALEIDLDPKQAELAGKGQQVIADGIRRVGQQAKQAVPAMDELQQRQENSLTTFQSWMRTPLNFFRDNMLEVVGVLKEFDLVTVASSVYLVKNLAGAFATVGRVATTYLGAGGVISNLLSGLGGMFAKIPGVGKLGGWLGGLFGGGKAAGGAAGGVADAATAAATTTKSIGTMFQSIGAAISGFFKGLAGVVREGAALIKTVLIDLGTGIGQFLAQVGKGLGTMIGGLIQSILTGIGSGLVALAPGLAAVSPFIPAILALGAAVGVLGWGLGQLAPVLRVFADFALAVLQDIVEVFFRLTTLSWGELAKGTVGLIGFAAGLLTFSVSLAAAAAPLGVALAAIALIDAGVGIEKTILGLVAAFDFDGRRIESATENALRLTKLMGAFVLLSAAMTGAGIVARISSMFSGLVKLLGGKSSGEALAASAKNIVATTNQIAAEFSNLNILDTASPNIARVGAFLDEFKAVAERIPTGAWEGLKRLFAGFVDFLAGDAYGEFASNAGKLVNASNTVAQAFALDVDGKTYDKAAANLRVVGGLFDALTTSFENAVNRMGVIGTLADQVTTATLDKVAAGAEMLLVAVDRVAKPVAEKLQAAFSGSPLLAVELRTQVADLPDPQQVRNYTMSMLIGNVESEDEGTHNRLDKLIGLMQALVDRPQPQPEPATAPRGAGWFG